MEEDATVRRSSIEDLVSMCPQVTITIISHLPTYLPTYLPSIMIRALYVPLALGALLAFAAPVS